MGVHRPLAATLAAALFFYEAFRLLSLVISFQTAPPEGPVNGIMPAYISSYALFPLMSMFVWLKPWEYRNYLNLYMAGKIITLVSFYVWGFFYFRDFFGIEYTANSVFLLGSSIFLNLTDILSVLGAWMVKNKYLQATDPEDGGL
jgi:hypothetical protein